jgi:hypothetical protein
MGKHVNAAEERGEARAAGGQDGAVVRAGRFGSQHRPVSALAQGLDQGMPAGSGADFGDDHQVGALLAGDPGGLPSGAAGRCVLGVEDQQPDRAGGGLVRWFRHGDERERAAGSHGSARVRCGCPDRSATTRRPPRSSLRSLRFRAYLCPYHLPA